MGSRTISWLALCLEADPDYWQDLLHPVIYEFPGRDFVQPDPSVFTLDDPQLGVLDGDGTPNLG